MSRSLNIKVRIMFNHFNFLFHICIFVSNANKIYVKKFQVVFVTLFSPKTRANVTPAGFL